MRPELIITLIAVFATVALVSGSLASMLLSRTAPERRRLRQFTGPRTGDVKPETLQLTDVPRPSLKKLSSMLPSASGDVSRLRRRLAAAGYDDYEAVVAYSAAQVGFPVVLGLLPIVVFGLSGGLVAALVGAAVGYVIPDAILMRKTAQHRKAIQDGLPDALDLIIVCVEAGSSLDQAILKASNELELALPAIARALRTVATETRAGKPRLEAFQDMARRAPVEDVRSLVAMLIQTDRFGTSISQSLRTHAETSRTKRRQRAEERASTVGVKLVFPLVLCLVPALYVVCLGPVVVTILRRLL
jgi:tight adherence protein C